MFSHFARAKPYPFLNMDLAGVEYVFVKCWCFLFALLRHFLLYVRKIINGLLRWQVERLVI